MSQCKILLVENYEPWRKILELYLNAALSGLSMTGNIDA
jgi:hypothetical protein